MAYKVIILYQLYMPSYFLGTFTEYPFIQTFNPTFILPSGILIVLKIRIPFQFYLRDRP